MKKIEKLNDEFFDKEISNFLNCYTVEEVPEEMIDMTVDNLRKYMTPKRTKIKIMEIIRNEITYINKIHFVVSIILLAIGLNLSMINEVSHYSILIFTSPIPMLLGMFELLKSKTDNMWEIEKSCKYSYSKIILARLIIITSFSMIFNIMLLGIYGYGETGDVLCKMLFSIIVPVCIVASINLYILSKLNSSKSIIATLLLGIGLMGTAEIGIVPYIEQARGFVLIVASIIAIIIFSLSICQFYKDSIKFEGEEISWN